MCYENKNFSKKTSCSCNAIQILFKQEGKLAEVSSTYNTIILKASRVRHSFERVMSK